MQYQKQNEFLISSTILQDERRSVVKPKHVTSQGNLHINQNKTFENVAQVQSTHANCVLAKRAVRLTGLIYFLPQHSFLFPTTKSRNHNIGENFCKLKNEAVNVHRYTTRGHIHQYQTLRVFDKWFCLVLFWLFRKEMCWLFFPFMVTSARLRPHGKQILAHILQMFFCLS